MGHFLSLRPIVRAYVSAVVAVGAMVLGLSVHSLFVEPIGSEWLLLAGLTILTGSFSVKVPSIHAHISVSEAFVFASVLLFGAEAGTVTVLLECLVILLWMKPQGRPGYRLFFNLAAPSVAIWTAGTCFYWLSGIHPYSQVFTPLPRLFLPLLAFTAAYFLFNSWLVAVAVGLEARCSPVQIWWKNFAWLSVNYFSGASVAALIVTYTQRLDLSTLAVIVPLLVVSYLTFRTAMGRAEDSYNHLSELNRLYLSTIETLAMAIDAKDQITHGHIRRVQIYAVGLAKHVGVTDEKLLKAIEAAALLHDMGKLAVPEHILNKPGKLTPAEFEKMKLHAGVGADILSAIDFPYPVVPIVRHHHENWNGTGYPTGLRGTDIPIGARILSVVDCFDALTSDRPYRPKLSDREALDILIERRGTMYDPLVVDTFVRVHTEISPEHAPSTTAISKGALAEITTSTISGREPMADDTRSGDEHSYVLPSTVVSALLDTRVDDSTVLTKHVATLVNCELVILFTYDGALDELVVGATSVVDGPSSPVKELRIALGERLSGWVAANRRTIINSDPTLDLGEFARKVSPTLANTLSVPIVSGKELLGVLALYREQAFSDADRTIVEQTSRVMAERLGTRQRRPGNAAEHTSGSRVPVEGPMLTPVSSLLYIEILNWPNVVRELGSTGAQELLALLTNDLKGALASGDLLVRSHDNELVALLARGEAKDVRALARQLREHVHAINLRYPENLRLDVAIDAMLAPIDASAIWDLLPADLVALHSQPVRQSRNRVH
jgi:putative nucleotidyltransferase with HDIG domain